MKTLMVLAMLSFSAAYAAEDGVKQNVSSQEIKVVDKKIAKSVAHKKHEAKKETKIN